MKEPVHVLVQMATVGLPVEVSALLGSCKPARHCLSTWSS